MGIVVMAFRAPVVSRTTGTGRLGLLFFVLIVAIKLAQSHTTADLCRLFLVRHGQSYPNVHGKIVSSLQEGIKDENGLTSTGRSQAEEAGRQLFHILLGSNADHLGVGFKQEPLSSVSIAPYCQEGNMSKIGKDDILILTSPFSRAKQTAEIIQQSLGCGLEVRSELRERWFGSLDGASDKHYQDIWAQDVESLTGAETVFGAETLESVAQRTKSVAALADPANPVAAHRYRAVVLVSHGDALQILQTALLRRNLRAHRALPHLGNCEVREVHWPPPRGAGAGA